MRLTGAPGAVPLCPFPLPPGHFQGTIPSCTPSCLSVFIPPCAPALPPCPPPQVASRELSPHGGYLVQASGGLVLAAFPRPEGALRWCLACQSAMVQQEWPEELLLHELGEELGVWSRSPNGEMQHRLLAKGACLSSRLPHIKGC